MTLLALCLGSVLWATPPVPSLAAGSYSGQVELTFEVRERGVSYYAGAQYTLEVTLTIDAAGQVELRAAGTVERHAAFLGPGGARDAKRSQDQVNDLWTGTALPGGVIRLETTTTIQPPRPVAHDLRCQVGEASIDGAPRPVLRCEPAAPYRDLPWHDLISPYLRVPLVLAEGGQVRSTIVGSHESASVQLGPRR